MHFHDFLWSRTILGGPGRDLWARARAHILEPDFTSLAPDLSPRRLDLLDLWYLREVKFVLLSSGRGSVERFLPRPSRSTHLKVLVLYYPRLPWSW